MTWHRIHQVKQSAPDIFKTSFPWRNGSPDWDTYNAVQNEMRYERNKRKKKAAPEISRTRCVFQDGTTGHLCMRKAEGMLEVTHNNQKALVPLCERHKETISNQTTKK